jgi:trigger factor
MTIKQTSNKNQTLVYDITVPTKDIDSRYQAALKELAQEVHVEGFRKGKAPLDLAEKALGKEKIYDKMIQTLLPEAYKQILEQDKIQPVIAPRVELKKAKEGEDWVLTMSIALKPLVTIPDYKKIAGGIRSQVKKDDIWIPGKEEDPAAPSADGKEAVEKREKYLNQFLKALLDKTKIELSELIVEQEINQRLARLLDDVRKIGLTIDAYFESRNTSQEKVKDEFKQDILNTYKLEYALNEIGDKESITIEKEEVDKLLASLPDEKAREEARQNVYVYSTMMRKQKILDFLASL